MEHGKHGFDGCSRISTILVNLCLRQASVFYLPFIQKSIHPNFLLIATRSILIAPCSTLTALRSSPFHYFQIKQIIYSKWFS